LQAAPERGLAGASGWIRITWSCIGLMLAPRRAGKASKSDDMHGLIRWFVSLAKASGCYSAGLGIPWSFQPLGGAVMQRRHRGGER
jgi:hypothetical protein